MRGYSVEIIGAKEMAKKFNLSPKIIGDATNKMLEMAVLVGEGEAKRKSPVLTGVLRGSIKSRVMPTRHIGEVETDVHYGIYQEYGTKRGIRPRYFFRSGKDMIVAKYEQIKDVGYQYIVKKLEF